MEFTHLRTLINSSTIQKQIDELLALKQQVDEKYLINPIAELHNFIQEKIQYCQEISQTLQQTKT